jgi:hypothetical protein
MKRLLSLLFVPQEKNNHRAALLQPAVLVVFVAFYLLNQSLIKTLTIIKPGVLGYSSEITSQKVFELTNQERQKNNLEALHYNSTLSESAKKKAEDMFKNDYWAHTSPQGKTPWDFLNEVGYQYTVAGENLAKDFSNNDSVIKAWMKSPSHKANILHPKYKEIGIAVVDGVLNGIKTTLVVQHFGVSVEPITNKTPDEINFNSKVAVAEDNPGVLARENSHLINPLTISKVVSSIMFFLIIFVLIIDAYIILKNDTHRLAGSSAGHVGFLLIILMFMIFSRQGAIF